MGLRGPAPKPTSLRILEGNRGHRPLNEREPTPLAGAPAMPRHLDAEARKEWRRLVPLLLSMKVLSEGDGIALALLCQAYSTMVAAQKMMQKAGKKNQSALLMRAPSGYTMQSPLLSIINAQVEIVHRQLQQFGLTPASRSRIVATTDPGEIDALERKLCGDL
jgi:P27 family predicted phage terminase small subunit